MKREFTDQMGHALLLDYPPKRIVSLVPSQTELLFDLGLDSEVVGLTKFCIHPAEKFTTTTKVGGTKKLKMEVIRALQPDLIIGNKEENTQAEIEALRHEFPVWMSDINNLNDALDAILRIGDLVDRGPEAAYLHHLIETGFRDLEILARRRSQPLNVAYLIWKSPYLFAGANTFIDDILRRNGWHNVVDEARYPELDLQSLAERGCELVLLSSEPYPFREAHQREIAEALPQARVLLVDGEMFSWYGSRLVKAIQYFFVASFFES